MPLWLLPAAAPHPDFATVPASHGGRHRLALALLEQASVPPILRLPGHLFLDTRTMPLSHSRREIMQDDYVSLFAFNRWANARMLDACRKLTPEQYAAEPVPGWSSVRFTVWHIAIVTEGWLKAVADDPDLAFPAEAELATVDDAERLLQRAYGRFDALWPTLTPEVLATPR